LNNIILQKYYKIVFLKIEYYKEWCYNLKKYLFYSINQSFLAGRGYNMDPVTHAITGVAVSKVLNQPIDISNPVFTAIVVGSVFPDIDILLQKGGDYVYLKNHRGVTHSIIGLTISSLLISFILFMIFRTSFIGILLGTWAGLFSHVAWDVFNSYGAKFFWPFYKKKISYSLLVVFDPIIFLQILAFILLDGWRQLPVIISFGVYLLFRLFMKLEVIRKAKTMLNNGIVKVYPSITNWFKWQFIVENKETYLVGERNFLNGRIKKLKVLKKMDENQMKKALESNVGNFFKDFTPVFHVESEEFEESIMYTFMDLRYTLKNNFLHHATIEIDKNENVVQSNFHPYSLDRTVKIPDKISIKEFFATNT
jgi:inner membrane protein